MTEQVMANSTLSTHNESRALGTLAPVILSVVLSTVILAAVGFAPGMAHNAAHDTRHVMVFPCH